MIKRVVYVLKIIVIIVLFPFFLMEIGRYVDDIYDNDMYWGGR